MGILVVCSEHDLAFETIALRFNVQADTDATALWSICPRCAAESLWSNCTDSSALIANEVGMVNMEGWRVSSVCERSAFMNSPKTG